MSTYARALGYGLMLLAIVIPREASAQRRSIERTPPTVGFFLQEDGSTASPTQVDPSRLPILRTRTTLNLDGVTLRDALRSIGEASGISFVYSESVVNSETHVRFSGQDVPVSAALNSVLADVSIDVVLRLSGGAALVARRTVAFQDVRGVVLDSASGGFIPGAVVMLLDSARTVLARNVSDEQGRYHISAGSDARYIRAVRIGFEPREQLLPHEFSGPRTIDVIMVPFRTTLASVRVTDKTRCPRRSDASSAAALWEQARAGLLASVVAREANPASIYRFGFERTFDGNADRITRFLVLADSATSAVKSFTAVFSASEFLARGFSKDSAGIQILLAPDADVMLDDAFSSGYCFRLAEASRKRPRQVGLAFSPVDRLRDRVDIDGTLWVDTVARALTDVEYRYIGLPKRTDVFRPGGLISFRMMANGTSLIDRWTLRGVGATQDTIRNASSVYLRDWLYATESGGELARAEWPDGRSWRAPLGSIAIHAVSSTGKPVRDALLSLPDSPYRARTDSAGNALIRELVPGPYALGVIDSRIASLGMTIPTTLKFTAERDSVIRATVKLPTAEEYLTEKCVASGHFTVGDSVIVVGRVISANGKPIENARVTFGVKTVNGLRDELRDVFKTGSDGVFHLCTHQLKPGNTVMLTVQIRDESSAVGIVELSREIASNLTAIPIIVGAAPPTIRRP